MTLQIAGTGSYLPEKVLDNQGISQVVETSDEWIFSRTGVKQRHIAEKESCIDMAVLAAKRALANAGMTGEDIDLVIVSTVSAEQVLPCIACEVQAAICAEHAAAFDINAACTGFITSCQVAAGQMAAGLCQNALLIGVEGLSNLVDWTDRGTCILFGDGAGAAVVTRTDSDSAHPFTAVLHADGTKGHVLTCNSGHGNSEKQKYGSYVQMDGKEIYRFAVKQVPHVIEEILQKANLAADEIDYFILHQANKRIIESIAKHLKLDISHFPMNMMDCGNMSSASIPVLLDTLHQQGKLQRGMKLVMAGFGAGLTWGGCYLEW